MSKLLTPDEFPQRTDRRQMRQSLRALRQQLTSAQQQRAALNVANSFSLTHAFRKARRIALYIANDGELNPAVLARRAVALGKECYLPVLHDHLPSMSFARWRPGDKLLRNRYDIPEPLPRAAHVAADELDLVCMPLVGFDARGNRLGMGGGFYDRTFAYRLNRRTAKPLLVGMAHGCQQVAALPVQAWDVPLDMIVTDERCYIPSGSR